MELHQSGQAGGGADGAHAGRTVRPLPASLRDVSVQLSCLPTQPVPQQGADTHIFTHRQSKSYSLTTERNYYTNHFQPMLDTVKMHPLLVTATKEKETTTERQDDYFFWFLLHTSSF